MLAHSSFDYAIVRVVPRVERGEFVNAGVIVFCRPHRFLDARVGLDWPRLAALAPWLDLAEAQRHLALIPLICAGHPDGGPIARLPQPERFHWLVAPRSAMLQPSPVHSGISDNPAAALGDLFDRLVRPVGP